MVDYETFRCDQTNRKLGMFLIICIILSKTTYTTGQNASSSTTTATPTLRNNYKGPNLSGAEFNSGFGKRYGYDYIYPSTKEIDYYAAKGFGIIRMPFDIVRAYPVPYGPLDTAQTSYRNTVINYCLTKSMRVILDPHNYGYIYDNRTGTNREIGADSEGTNLFADFWSRMATMYKNYTNVVFGLMNEPHAQTASEWYTGAIAAINAIRAANATQLILIPGTSWTGAHSWVSSGNGAAWAGFTGDSLNNFAFEMHQYLDSDSSGTHNTCVANAYTRLIASTNWLITNGFKGFLGEFAWSTDLNCMNQSTPFMDYLTYNSSVWMGWSWWAGGPWYSTTYMFMIDPVNYTGPVDRPQMAVLLQHL